MLAGGLDVVILRPPTITDKVLWRGRGAGLVGWISGV